MQYRKLGKTGEEISILGYGCMRFPAKNGRIDMERTEKQILMAIEKGVNYFDTAYIYPGSEAALGTILEKHQLRSRVKIATKLPPYLATTRASMENILKTQLERLKTPTIDYYLIHAIADFRSWEKAKANGIVEFLNEKKKEGVIGHVGFSYHGDKLDFPRLIDDYPWDFCQIQYNYIDENSQAGREGLQYAYQKGIGVVIMEPLRGGSLVGRMPDKIKTIWEKAETKRSYADWALRWLWDQEEVSVVLSGLNEEAHIEENIRVASEVKPHSLTPAEITLFQEVKEAYLSLMKVGCTGCSYCLPGPAGVNIPYAFSCYNGHHLFHDIALRFQYLLMNSDVSGRKNGLAHQCIACGKCEKHCPQHLPIREHLKAVKKDMEPWWGRAVVACARFTLKVLRAFSPKGKRVQEAQE